MRITGLILFLTIALSSIAVAQDTLESPDTPINSSEPEEKRGFKNKIKNLRLGEGLKDKKESIAITLALKKANAAENRGNYLIAIHHYQKAIDLQAKQGNQVAISEYSQHIALLYHKAGQDRQALDQYEKVLDRKEIMGDTSSLKTIRDQLSNLQQTDNLAQIEAGEIPQLDEVTKESQRLRTLAQSTENNGDYKSSLEYYKLYTELNNRLQDEEQAQILALQEKTFQLEKQGQQMSLLESEKEVQALTLAQQEQQLTEEQTFRRNLLIGVLLLLAAALTAFILYRGKKRALGALNKAYDHLNLTKDKLVTTEGQLKDLLDQQVSKGVAQQLLGGLDADQAQKKFVCVMFLDIRGFTPFAEKLQPEELIAYQNDVFGIMIDIIDHHQGVINQFLGDGFMATFGLQEDAETNLCENAVKASQEIITIVNSKSKQGVIPTTRVGIGLHAGNVVAGNVGTSIRKQYSITGNTVITAARIEQLNKEFNSQLLISKEVFSRLNHLQDLPQDFLEVIVKGRKEPVELLKIA